MEPSKLQANSRPHLPGSKGSENVTVLVFKDNYAARTFNIPLCWISRLGWLSGLMVCVIILSTFAAIKYYRIAAMADLNHVQDLEQEIIDLRTSLKNGESKNSDALKEPPSPSPPSPSPGIHAPIFTSFPSSVQLQLPEDSTLPFSVLPPKISWSGKTLRVRFALQYIKQDQGTQEGKILIVARGPGVLLSYPTGTLAQAGGEFLFAPDKGESFAVSRFREVKADFEQILSRNSIQHIEIFLINPKNQLLFYQKLATPQESSQPKPESPSSP